MENQACAFHTRSAVFQGFIQQRMLVSNEMTILHCKESERRNKTTIPCCAKSQKSADLIYTAAQA